ncbi:interleukin-7 receptor subunit alpha-like isoform X2 [Pseudorasbora parva]|uniref:interleukin-7 receptor subunit alpha-like isoform X2 n=1 Tax=Pseudorasbora parva TaxID=51549 RepID=UPI00351DCB8A
MAGVLRILLVVFCPLVLSESGDDDWYEREVTCTSTLTLVQTNLTCSLNDEPNEEVKLAALCRRSDKMCEKATLGLQDFTFENLFVLVEYNLKVHIGDEVIQKRINLRKIVKIPAPEIKLATYMEDTNSVFIWFEHNHDYITNPVFQMEIWRDKPANKFIRPMLKYRNYSISMDELGGAGVYYTRVRAKPDGYFNGDWSEWSSTASFTIKTNSTVHIAIGCSVFLLVIIILGALLWRMQKNTHHGRCTSPVP